MRPTVGRGRGGPTGVPRPTGDAVFAGQPPDLRARDDHVLARLEASGPVHEDAVSVGVFHKAERTICEVRPMVRLVKLHLFLPRPVAGARQTSSTSWWLQRSLTTDVVPDDVLALLDEAYDAAS